MTPHDIARATLDLVRARGPGSTICPSEVARSLAADDWRSLMPAVRDVAASLAANGHLRITRGGVEVSAQEPGGPIRLGCPPEPADGPGVPPSR